MHSSRCLLASHDGICAIANDFCIHKTGMVDQAMHCLKEKIYLALLIFIFRAYAMYCLGLSWVTEFPSPKYLTDSYNEVFSSKLTSDLPH